MPGSIKGGTKLIQTAIKKHGSYEAWKEWMRTIAAKGGRAKTDKLKGFARNPKLASEAGSKGGSNGRGKTKDRSQQLSRRGH